MLLPGMDAEEKPATFRTIWSPAAKAHLRRRFPVLMDENYTAAQADKILAKELDELGLRPGVKPSAVKPQRQDMRLLSRKSPKKSSYKRAGKATQKKAKAKAKATPAPVAPAPVAPAPVGRKRSQSPWVPVEGALSILDRAPEAVEHVAVRIRGSAREAALWLEQYGDTVQDACIYFAK